VGGGRLRGRRFPGDVGGDGGTRRREGRAALPCGRSLPLAARRFPAAGRGLARSAGGVSRRFPESMARTIRLSEAHARRQARQFYVERSAARAGRLAGFRAATAASKTKSG